MVTRLWTMDYELPDFGLLSDAITGNTPFGLLIFEVFLGKNGLGDVKNTP